MFTIEKVRGTTDVSVPIYVIDSSDGTPETGYAFNTSGIDLWYRREGGSEVSITEATLAGWNAAHSDGGVIHGSDGRGRLDLPDAACAVGTDGASYVEYGGTITGMIVVGGTVRLTHETAISGLFSGTHSTTSGDLGTNAPANSIIGMTIYFPTVQQSRVIETYNTGTGVAGWTTALAAAPQDNEPWEIFPTAPIDAVTLAAINAQVDTALGDYDAPTKAELDSGLAALNDPTAAAIADAVWDEAKSGHVGAGSFGEEVQAHALSSEISALNDLSAAEVNAEVDTALGDYDAPTKAELDSGLAALNDLDAAGVRTALGLSSANLDTQLSAIQAVVDLLELANIRGVAQTGTLTVNACSTDLTGYADDELIGRVIIFTGGTAAGQAAAITDYASTGGVVSFTGGVQTAPANNDSFVIV